MRHWFTAEGWDYCFRKLPAVFRSYANLKFLAAAGFDPARDRQPSLSFVRSVSQQWGGMIARRGHPNAAGCAGNVGRRRDAYASGAYQPVSYLMVAAKGDSRPRETARGPAVTFDRVAQRQDSKARKSGQSFAVFAEALNIDPARVSDELAYNSIKEWDSIAHMALVSVLEDRYGIMLETEDVIDMSSVGKARSILAKYDVIAD